MGLIIDWLPLRWILTIDYCVYGGRLAIVYEPFDDQLTSEFQPNFDRFNFGDL